MDDDVLIPALAAATKPLTASVTNAHARLLCLAIAACCATVVSYATRPERGLQ
jgi:hypothetical protein